MEERKLTEGPIFPSLIGFALPVMASLFLQALYGAVDLVIVGHFAENADVSAVSTGSQIMSSLTVVAAGLAMGVTVLVGENIGRRCPKEAGKAIGTGIVVFAILAVILTAVTAGGANLFAKLMQAPAQAYDKTVSYMRICGAGYLFIVAYNVIGSIFRGTGDSKTPLITVAIATVFNICGDLFLVAVCKMGATGAAVATIGAQALSVIISLIIISKRKHPFEFDISFIKLDPEIAKKEISIGAPLALVDLLVSMSFWVLLAIVNSFGVIPSAGMGVAEKITAFLLLMPIAFAQTMTAFVAQNVGAGHYDRNEKALRICILMALCTGLVIGTFTFIKGNLLAGIFSGDPEVVQQAHSYLRSYAIDCVLTPILFSFHGYFNGNERTKFVLLECFIGAGLIRVPLGFLMSSLFGANLFLIGLATPCSTVVQILLCLIFYNKMKREVRV